MTHWPVIFAKPSRALGWASLVAVCVTTAAAGDDLAIRFAPIKKGDKLVVEVTGLANSDLRRLRDRRETEMLEVLAVRVDGARTTMLGSYRIENGRLRFESRFPASPGLKYRADFNPAKVPIKGVETPITRTTSVPKPPVVATTELVKVFPTRDDLPENQLKFYLHFSAPMGRGDAYSHIRLIDEKGKAVFNPFLELGEELWDSDGKRFTLFLHPGRIKRGLKMRDELGPILEEGRRYTLAIDAKWLDAEGNPLKKVFRKSFSVGKPDETQPNPKLWTLEPPAAGKADPLIVGFPEPLDHALLNRVVWIEDVNGKRMPGSIKVFAEETRWKFTPEKPWLRGQYRLVAETILEDLAGNSIARPFEVDIIQPLPQPNRGRTISRVFEIK